MNLDNATVRAESKHNLLPQWGSRVVRATPYLDQHLEYLSEKFGKLSAMSGDDMGTREVLLIGMIHDLHECMIATREFIQRHGICNAADPLASNNAPTVADSKRSRNVITQEEEK